MGAERSCLVKRLPDDRKIRGILLLTGCCFAHFFPPFLRFFFCSKCFLSVCFQSSCLGSTISATGPRTQTHGEEKTRTGMMSVHAPACVCVCVIGETDLILCSRIGGNGGEEEEPFTHKDVFPSANYRDRL